MYDELVKRLRDWPKICAQYEGSIDQLHDEAADAIEQLTADLERSKEWATFWEKEANEALKKFQTTVASIPRWIPVTERLPDKPGIYAVWTAKGFGNHLSASYFDGDSWSLRITHWMPLHTPPTAEEDE